MEAVAWLCLVFLRIGLIVISEFCGLLALPFPYRFRGLWKLWRGRLAAGVGFLSGIGFYRLLHCWRIVGLGFLASSPVRFCCAVAGWVFVRRFRPVGFGLFAVTVKLSEWVFVLG